MNINVIKDIIHLTHTGEISFPQVVARLLSEGIEAYHVDFIRGENTYYMATRTSHREPLPHKFRQATTNFNVEGVRSAIQKIQTGQGNYNSFSDEIIDAGCVFYIAYLTGKRVVYFGRNGDFHVEHFPAQANP